MLHSAQGRRGEPGYILATALLALAVMAILAAVAMRQATSALRTAERAVREEQALYLANAGVEWALSRAQADIWEPTYERELELEEGVLGRYAVTVVDQGDRWVVVSTGTVRRGRDVISRTVEAEIGLVPGEETPSLRVPVAFQQAILVDGELTIPNHAKICGDVLATGPIHVMPNGRVWGSLRQDNASSPCKSVVGTGKVVSASWVTFQGNATDNIEGGWCDPDHWGDGTPCPTPPDAAAMGVPEIDVTALRSRAAEWWVKTNEDCREAPAGAVCRVDPSGKHKMQGSVAFSGPTVIYVQGTLELDDVRIAGPVTFVVDGEIQLSRVTCGEGKAYCPIGLLATQGVELAQKAEGHAIIHTEGQFTVGGNHAELYGNVVARRISLSNHFTQHAMPPGAGVFPPGLPTAAVPGEGDSGEEDAEAPVSGWYIRWRQ